MFIALISTFIASISDVSWKKSLSYGVRTRAHALGSYPIPIVLCIYFVLSGFDFFSVTLIPISVILIIALLDIIKDPVNAQLYKEEKISVIMPYLNLSKVLVIIISFFLYKDVSNITFWITIFVILIIILASIDLKNKRFPKCFSKILFVETVRTVWILLWWWLLLRYSEVLYFNLYAFLYLIPAVFLAYKSWQLWDILTPSLPFWWYRIIGWLGWFSWFLSLTVIKNLGLSISILLWFLGIGITLFVSYIFLKDIPSRKNILLTFTVAILIWIWYYFK